MARRIFTPQRPDLENVVGRAIALRREGRLGSAIALLAPHVTLSPGGATVALTLGKLYAESGEMTRAGRWLTRAVEIAPDSLDARLALATWRAQTGDLSRASLELHGVVEDVCAEMVDLQDRAERDETIPMASLERLPVLDELLHRAALNLSAVLLETGDLEGARLWPPLLLTHPDFWEHANALMAMIVERSGQDPLVVAREELAEGRTSPPMLEFLLSAMLQAQPVDLAAMDAALGQAAAAFAEADAAFAWWDADKELAATLERLHDLAREAMLRGRVDPSAVGWLLRRGRPLMGVAA
jgi:tetratricopeptide (TPR) repeat protein